MLYFQSPKLGNVQFLSNSSSSDTSSRCSLLLHESEKFLILLHNLFKVPSTEALLYIIFLITQQTPPPICFYSENKFTLTPVRSNFERFEVLVGRMKGI